VKKVWIGVAGVIVVGVLVFFNLRSDRGSKTSVQTVEVKRRDVSKLITASGTIRPKRRVNVSATAMGKIKRLAVEEGDVVNKGDFLLQIDPLPYASVVDQLSAAVRGAAANLELQQASLKKAKYDLEHAEQLAAKGFTSETALRDAQVALEIAEAQEKAAAEALAQQKANLSKARHDLNEVRITAEMAGVITALNVEEGESAIMGTLNNPGTVLLTIADLSQMEARVDVDETEVVFVEVGQRAEVRLDAYRDTSFAGVVTEVANSARRAGVGMGQESVDFEIVIAIDDSIPNIRPGLSASVDITVADERDALAIPIACLTVRDPDRLGGPRRKGDADEKTEDDSDDREKKREVEGVFVVDGGKARFRPVRVGIAGQHYFVVQSGLALGEAVVSGPFSAINELRNGGAIKVKKESKRNKEDS